MPAPLKRPVKCPDCGGVGSKARPKPEAPKDGDHWFRGIDLSAFPQLCNSCSGAGVVEGKSDGTPAQ